MASSKRLPRADHPHAVISERLTNQLLCPPGAPTVADVVARILAVQSQDLRGARLAVRARSTGLSSTDIDDAFAARQLVVTWLNRGTLHLVTAADHWWLHGLTAPRTLTANRRRLAQEGVTPREAARGIEVVSAAVADDGPLTRAELRARLDAARIPTAGQALVHVLMAASLDGHLVRGPMVGRDHAFVSAAAWLGPRPPFDRDAALALLARRYLVGHGPAAAEDLAAWAGLSLGDARRALAAIADETDQRADGLVAAVPAPAAAPTPPPRLLGPFDPVLHGWSSRDEIVGGHRGVVTSNGIFRPIALVDGRAVATWGLAGEVLTVRPLDRIGARDKRSLDEEAADVQRFLGLPARPPVWDEPGAGLRPSRSP